MQLQATDHSYYCNESNYYVGNRCGENFGRSEYNTWADFKEGWLYSDGVNINIDYNLCFRFDIKQNPEANGYELWLFFMLQRKGIYRPVLIKHLEEKDMPNVEQFLKMQWEYIQNQWKEIAEN